MSCSPCFSNDYIHVVLAFCLRGDFILKEKMEQKFLHQKVVMRPLSGKVLIL